MIVTRVGDDPDGDELVAFLRERRVDTDYVQRDGTRPTGTVVVTIEHAEPQFAISEQVAWDNISTDDHARTLVRTADAICIGSLAQRHEVSRAAIRELLAEGRGQALIVFDVNLRSPFIDAAVIEDTLLVSDVVKMSEAEVAMLSTLLDRPSLIGWLVDKVGVQAVCVTRGRDGATITTPERTVTAPGIESNTSAGDVVGAGDAFTAAMAHQLVRDAAPEETLRAANLYAALIATKKGAMPMVSQEELAAIGM